VRAMPRRASARSRARLAPSSRPEQVKWRAARIGSIASTEASTATRSASSPPMTPPTVAPAAILPT
jgi:hypothetical protein